MKKIFLIVIAMVLMLCCTACAAEHDALHQHKYDENIKEVTCTEEGYTTYTCSCGYEYVDNRVKAKGHNYTEKTTVATCTAQGYTTYTCSCGYSYVANYTVFAHTYSNYRCTKCSAVDKIHAYEYLVSWIKQNYNDTSSTGYIFRYTREGTVLTLSYQTNYDKIVFALMHPNGQQAYLVIMKNNMFQYNNQYIGNEAYGNINSSTYVPYSKLDEFIYTGLYGVKSEFQELTEITVGNLVSAFSLCISTNIPEISIKDLGFAKC